VDVGDLVGAVLCTGIPGTGLDAELTRALDRLRPSGIILFRRNYESVAQLRKLTRELHALPSSPLVCIDHEGGSVMRLGSPFTQFPPARAIAATGDPDMAYAVGRAMARELASAGIDLSYAPVLDVSSNPRNPIIGERAFGTDAETVVAYALPFMRGLHEGGVVSCGKHFPGHGDTDRDSHLELPVVRRSLEEIEAVELAPFRAAVAARIPALMTAHVVYPALDEHNPATLSARILEDLLRREMGFTGVLVSDDLQMRAVSARTSLADAAVRSLQAGVDWLLICNDFQQTLQVAAKLGQALEKEELDPAAVAAAAARIRTLVKPSRIAEEMTLPVADHELLNQRIRNA
jgi:beta-N-acetylhexosaminidase